jgi:hypothetical protein
MGFVVVEGEAASLIGEAASRVGEAASLVGEAASLVGEAASLIGEAASLIGGHLVGTPMRDGCVGGMRCENVTSLVTYPAQYASWGSNDG